MSQTFIDDDFSLYNDGYLATESGGIWQAVANDHIVTSHSLKGTSTGPEKIASMTTWPGSTGEQWAECTVSGTVQYQGPMVHSYIAGGPGGYIFEANVNGTECDVYALNGAGQIVKYTAQVNAGDRMRIEWLSTPRIKCYIDTGSGFVQLTSISFGSETANAGDIPTGRPAVRIYESGSNNIITRATFGDFSAGSGVTYPELERGRNRGVNRGVSGGIARSFVRKDRIFVPRYATYPLQEAA